MREHSGILKNVTQADNTPATVNYAGGYGLRTWQNREVWGVDTPPSQHI